MSTRDSVGSGLSNIVLNPGEKVGLDEIKRMVGQGEQLCEERKSKELSRALGVVDLAEEVTLPRLIKFALIQILFLQWISRVKDFMANGHDVEISVWQELLDETEGMPVAMIEADLIRSYTPHLPVSLTLTWVL